MTTPTKDPRGGRRPGAGRPEVKPGQETVVVSIRMGIDQRAKLEQLGGAQWVRDRIDRAKLKPPG